MTEQSAESIFGQAIEIQSDEDRAAFLNEACGGNQQLRTEVEKLVADHFRAGSFLEQPVINGEATAAMPPGMEQVGSQIGPYKLRERLGEGGMGVVWAAEQKQPLRRKVALKVIKPGMDSSQVIARFEAEREALALMDHPNIARVLDAGTTEQGRPYFVMELIRGVPITEYCDAHKLTIRERLELFTHVCKAVQHAHQKGIIHRDIKPSNVLVTEQDGSPVPKVIDFGVAKALHQPLTDRSVYTGVFQAIGTLAYMSPEQATLSANDVDTRADVYGLGVLLYELLTGETPFDRKQLESAALDEACRIIREQDPPKPSTRIGTLGEKSRIVAQGRQADPKTLSRAVRRELDWIAMKALAKDRSLRYDTANAFASDVERYLRNEPVVAHPPSATYRLRRFIHRNRGPVLAASLVGLALFVGGLAKVTELVRVSAIQAELRHLLTKMAAEYAIAGDSARAHETISAAINAGASPNWEPIIKGMESLYSRRSMKAVEHLQKLVETDPDNVAALGVLTAAHLYTGGISECVEAMKQLRESEPSEDYEYLFRGYPEIYEDSATAEEYLRLAVRNRNAWPLAHAMLAEALAQRCLDEPNHEQAMKLAREAIDYSEKARTVLGRNPFVISISLHVHHVAMRRADKQETKYGEWERAAAAAAEKLEPFDQFIMGRWIRGAYFDFLDQPEKAEADYLAAVVAGAGPIYKSYYAAFLFKHFRTEEAFETAGDRGTQLAIADLPNARAVAMNYVTSNGSQRSIYLPIWSPELLGYLGQRKEAQERWDAFDEQDANTGFYFLDYPLQLFAEMKTPEELLAEATSSSHRAAIHFFAGRLHLYHGDRVTAEQDFQRCIEMDVFTNTYLDLSKGILKRMEADENWPSFE